MNICAWVDFWCAFSETIDKARRKIFVKQACKANSTRSTAMIQSTLIMQAPFVAFLYWGNHEIKNFRIYFVRGLFDCWSVTLLKVNPAQLKSKDVVCRILFVEIFRFIVNRFSREEHINFQEQIWKCITTAVFSLISIFYFLRRFILFFIGHISICNHHKRKIRPKCNKLNN